MIQTATYDDLWQLRELWKTVFGDGDRFLDSFFGNLFRPEECLVTRSDGTITAMLFMLEGVWSGKTGDRPLRYVYACATHPGHRRQGLMGSLLTEAAGYAEKNGFELALVPEDHLVDYYGRFGFTEPSYLYMRKYPAPEAAKDGYVWQTAENAIPESENAARSLFELRRRFWHGRDAVLWPQTHLKVALEELFAQNGEFLVMKGGEGYALTLPEGNMIKIVECASIMEQDWTINSLRNHYRTIPTLFSLAGGVCASCAEKPYALFRKSRSGPAPYINLALDL